MTVIMSVRTIVIVVAIGVIVNVMVFSRYSGLILLDML